MFNTVPLLIDKSALQSLSRGEARWLFHHFTVVLTATFFSEVISDLKKQKIRSGATPEQEVQRLAQKINDAFVEYNADISDIMEGEARGFSTPLDGWPAISGGELVTLTDGTKSYYEDRTEFQQVIWRWKEARFEEAERLYAKEWRALTKTDLESVFRKAKHLRQPRIRYLREATEYVDDILFNYDSRAKRFRTILDAAGVSSSVAARAMRRWKNCGCLNPRRDFKAICFVARVNMIFAIATLHGFVTPRPTNIIDVDYFRYAPFSKVFVSNDLFHEALHHEIMMQRGGFVKGTALKIALSELNEYYSSLEEKVKMTGSANYAAYPPTFMHNAVTDIYDSVLPNWRLDAAQRRGGPAKSRPGPSFEEVMRRVKAAQTEYEKIRGQR